MHEEKKERTCTLYYRVYFSFVLSFFLQRKITALLFNGG